MSEQINKKILLIILVFISLTLVLAFIIEHKFDHQPCKLCIYERIPYFVSIFLIAKFFFTKNYNKITLLILSLVFFTGSILAFYHFGIEQGFFKESFVCANANLSETLTKEELLEQLNQNTISCKDVSFRIFGFSLAAINTIFSFVIGVILIRMFIDYGKN